MLRSAQTVEGIPVTMTIAEATTPPRPAVAELLLRAEVIARKCKSRAQQTEINRRVCDEVIDDLRAAGLFRILQPAAYGGYEYDYDVLSRLISTIGRGCGSTAWVYGIACIHQWLVACMPAVAQDEFWADRGAIAAGSYPPSGKTIRVEGGFRTTGSWAFASGSDIAQWLFIGTMTPPADGEGAPRPMFLLLPKSDVRIEDNWHTMGLAGTGSKNIVAEDLFIPEHRAIAVSDLIMGSGPGTLVNTNPLYRQSMLSVLPSALVSAVLGMAEGGLADFVEGVKVRTTRGAVAGGNRRMAEFATVQSRVAEATAAIDAARLLLTRDLLETHASAMRGEHTSIEMRIRNRLDHAFCAKLAVQAVDALFTASGGQSIFLEKPIQRIWRDAHAAGSHLSLNWDAVGTMYGQHTLGLEPQGQY